jgi:glutamyl-tRNA reductase
VETFAATAPVETAPSPALMVPEIPPTLNVMCMGISIHNSDVSVREKVAIKMDEWVTSAQDLVKFSHGVIAEAAVLSTCNRFELYFTCEKGKTAESEALVARWLEGRSGLTEEKLKESMFVLQHDEAVKHILRVSAGLDSLVVGEGQILSQVNSCHQAATGKGGQAGKVLARLLNQAVQSGKKVRDKTGLARGAVSISSAAIEFAEERAPQDLHKVLKDSTVAVVGAGTMARLLLVHLKSRGVTSVVICNGNIGEGSRAAALVDEFGKDMDIVLRPLSEMYDVIATHDFSFFATAAQEPIVAQADLASALDTTHRENPVVIVDICVPRNVEQDVGKVANTFSYNVDRLKDVVARNTEARRGEIIKAEDMLKDDMKQWLTWHMSLAAVPTLKRLREQAELVRQKELQKYGEQMSQMTKKQQQTIDRFTEGLVKSLMHQPMVQLNSLQEAEEAQQHIGEFNRLFNLYGGGEARRKEEAVELLELLANDMAMNTAADMVPKRGLDNSLIRRGFDTVPEDLQTARTRERLAELKIIENVACGIMQATMNTVDIISGRQEFIRDKSVARRVYVADASVKARSEETRGTGGLDVEKQDVSFIKRQLLNEGKAENKVLGKLARGLAEVTVNTVAKLQERAETIRLRELTKSKKYFKSLTQQEAELVEKISRGIVNTLMAGPTSHLTSAQDVDDKTKTLDSFASLFGVSTGDASVDRPVVQKGSR